MSEKNLRILAVDDNDDALYALTRMLEHQGHKVFSASHGKAALAVAEAEVPDLILLDVMMPEMDGYQVTRTLKAHDVLRYIPVILLTAKDNLEDVIFGLEQGADDYIKKPFKQEELLARVNAAARTRRLYQELKSTRGDNAELRKRVEERYSFANIIGKSRLMTDIYTLIEKVKDSTLPVLVTGESGTGKELVASAIHYLSPRKERPFVVQNCSALTESLLESELFGHVKGAFTGAIRDKAGLFEAAHTGTFFLDELGEMSPALQVKLLRVLQDGTFTPVGGEKSKKVDVRIVAATNRDLKEMTQKGTFREDLYYRLAVVPIRLPALRERKVDIPLLVEHFLTRAADKQNSGKKSLLPDTLAVLVDYNWPGNVRELENELERLVVMSGSERSIGPEHLSPHILSGGENPKNVEGKLKDAIERLEKEMILATLERLAWNKSEAARELGISRSNLIAKVNSYGITK